ncbi:MAG: DUF2807 domain-containing protein [Flavobacteriaceae bacterium]|nr:DUF2807 domain-containing protein [Flavobacteriaceae bacterium]
MTTITKFIVAIILTFLLASCQFNAGFGPGVNGDGNVQTIEREIKDFNQVKVSRGLDVELTQAQDISIRVQADENLHDIIMTKVENNVLHIYAEENIHKASSKTILVNFTNLDKVSASSGSDVISTNTIKSDILEIKGTSGSYVELNVLADVIECKSTSGSQIEISGKTNTLYGDATSGSSIRADNLNTQMCDVKATSGAKIKVNTSNELIAKATSGARIIYSGNPEKITKNDGVSGSIRKQ